MLSVPYKTILFVYLQREWEDGHKKMKKQGYGYLSGTHAGPSLLSQLNPL
jgi:hypothetical protein